MHFFEKRMWQYGEKTMSFILHETEIEIVVFLTWGNNSLKLNPIDLIWNLLWRKFFVWVVRGRSMSQRVILPQPPQPNFTNSIRTRNSKNTFDRVKNILWCRKVNFPLFLDSSPSKNGSADERLAPL